MPGTIADELEQQLKAAMHPMRARILATIGKREMSPSEVVDEWVPDVDGEDRKQAVKRIAEKKALLGTVSYHVRTLHEQGLVRLVRTGHVRGALKSTYAVQPEVLKRMRGELQKILDDLDRANGRA